MKKIAIISLLFSLSIRCSDGVNTIQYDIKREITTIFHEGSLDVLLQGNNQEKSGRIEGDFLSRINPNFVYKISNRTDNSVSYTIPLIRNKANFFENLVIKNNTRNNDRYVLRYVPTKKWLEQRKRAGGYDTYSGLIEIVELNGKIRASTKFIGGKAVSPENLAGGRSSSCSTWIDVQYAEVCVGGYCSLKEVVITYFTVCDDSSGGGGNNGGSGTGGTGSAGGGGGSGGGGSRSDQVTDLGGSGFVDPVDVSYYLIPVNPNDKLSNPYHGMKAKDSHGTVYTYDSNLKVWLLPDVTVMLNNGAKLSMKQGNFGGQVLSTLTAIALVEPTPIGEIVVGGILLVVFVYEAYQISTAIKEDEWETCLKLYEMCNGYKCGDCLSICRRELGAWPFEKCPF